jgi:hypothetical protein
MSINTSLSSVLCVAGVQILLQVQHTCKQSHQPVNQHITDSSALCVAGVQILLQVQQMSSLPQTQQYRGLWDALRRIPSREGGIAVSTWAVGSSSSSCVSSGCGWELLSS